jgi:ubiquinone biosynthesis protein UbiJ
MLKDFSALPAPPALSGLLQALGNETLARITLLINHVIASEPAAMARLATQADKSVRVEWRAWPNFLPGGLAARLPLPTPACWRVSRAGLLGLEVADTVGTGTGTGDAIDPLAPADTTGEPGLVVTLDPGDLGRWLLAAAGGRPPMEIRGDAELAAEVGWLAENLRWDIEDDLARIVGELPAHQLAKAARWMVDAARRLAATGMGVARSTADGLASLRPNRSNEQ